MAADFHDENLKSQVIFGNQGKDAEVEPLPQVTLPLPGYLFSCGIHTQLAFIRKGQT
jgi:hypothetical protein